MRLAVVSLDIADFQYILVKTTDSLDRMRQDTGSHTGIAPTRVLSVPPETWTMNLLLLKQAT